MMNSRKRSNSITVSLAIAITCIPISIIMTIFASSFWQWIEQHFKIESYGHSGPADWCYLVSYSVLLSFSALTWCHLKNRRASLP